MLVLAWGEGLALDRASDPFDRWLRLHKLVTGVYTAQHVVTWHIINRLVCGLWRMQHALQGQLACYVTMVNIVAR